MREAFVRAITEAAGRDSRIMLLTADLGYKLFDDFARRCPGRFLNMGVCEANMVSVAAGLALEGKRPFTYSIVPFATLRCLEQIRNDVCNMALPVVVVGVGAGFAYGVNGPTHHGVDDLAAMRALPGMTVVCPCDPRETGAAVSALLEHAGPGYLRLGRAGEPILPGTDGPLRLGQPTVLREGKDLAVLVTGALAGEVLRSAALLAEQGLNPLVLSVHTLKPLEGLQGILGSRRIRHVVTVEEHGPCGGLFEAFCAAIARWSSRPTVVGLHAPDAFQHACSSQRAMWKELGLEAAAIERAAAGLVERST